MATAISTGIGTAIMGLVANYPWVVSAQIGKHLLLLTVDVSYHCGPKTLEPMAGLLTIFSDIHPTNALLPAGSTQLPPAMYIQC